jgi:NADP-dependent 3-hydroxy acid dehydrogenase YdfG
VPGAVQCGVWSCFGAQPWRLGTARGRISGPQVGGAAARSWKAYLSQLTRLLRTELGPKMVRVATIEPGMVDTELPDHVTDPVASELMATLLKEIDCLESADVAETVAFMVAAPRHVNLTEITVLPTAQAI